MKSANNVELANKAGKLQDFVEKHLIDENGVIYSGINTDTMKPWRSEDFSEGDEFIPVGNYAPSDIINYENSGMTTGAYLAAMAYKFIAKGKTRPLNLPDEVLELLSTYMKSALKRRRIFPENIRRRIFGPDQQ